MARVRVPLALALAFLAQPSSASAGAPSPPSEDEALFQAAVSRMHEGKPGEAIADFEALADHGIVDASLSFDRGLAYATRVRVGAEQAGDLGEAAHGFLEAKVLAADRGLDAEATRALTLVRAEVGRRRARAGEPVDFDPGMALAPSFLRLLPEDGWALVGIVGSLIVGLALFVRRASRERRSRIAAVVTSGVGSIFLALGAAATFAARHERLTVARAVIVSAGARPTDERGLVVANAPILPEAAEVEIVGHRAGWTHVRWGSTLAWVPAASVREIAERER